MSPIAVVVADMWDTHWCKTLAAGTAALAFHIDAFLHEVRRRGGSVIHAPAQTEHFYRDWPQYTAAQALRRRPRAVRDAPAIQLPNSIGCGCDHATCLPPDTGGETWPWPWTRQHERITVEDRDFIVCEDGDAAYGVIEATSPSRVVICGVHTDACVLDRPFGMKALWRAGIDITLLCDLTEASKPGLTRDVVRAIAKGFPIANSWELT